MTHRECHSRVFCKYNTHITTLYTHNPVLIIAINHKNHAGNVRIQNELRTALSDSDMTKYSITHSDDRNSKQGVPPEWRNTCYFSFAVVNDLPGLNVHFLHILFWEAYVHVFSTEFSQGIGLGRSLQSHNICSTYSEIKGNYSLNAFTFKSLKSLCAHNYSQ